MSGFGRWRRKLTRLAWSDVFNWMMQITLQGGFAARHKGEWARDSRIDGGEKEASGDLALMVANRMGVRALFYGR